MRLACFLVVIILMLCGCDNVQEVVEEPTDKVLEEVDFKVHTFYYNWYGNVEHDGEQFHWNHDVLPHWSDPTWDDVDGFPGGENIGANYYPELGCYSSSDVAVIDTHMQMIRKAGIGVVVITWWGKDSFEDKSIGQYLTSAEAAGLKVAIHVEPFYDSAEEFKDQIDYLSANYGDHPGLFCVKDKPLYYVYDSYKLDVEEWKKLMLVEGELTLRNTSSDGVFIGLWVKENDGPFFVETGLDGFYTYFASDGFEYGCTSTNWLGMSAFAKANDLLFVPCAGPGYIDTRIRPWNAQNTKGREKGRYYEDMFHAAAATWPDFIGITSFNEWHEGTQIEPAVGKSVGDYTYEDYGPGIDSWFYIHKTRELVESMRKVE